MAEIDQMRIALELIAEPNPSYGKCEVCGHWAKGALMCDCVGPHAWVDLEPREIASAALDGTLTDRMKPMGRTLDNIMTAMAARHGGIYKDGRITLAA